MTEVSGGSRRRKVLLGLGVLALLAVGAAPPVWWWTFGQYLHGQCRPLNPCRPVTTGSVAPFTMDTVGQMMAVPSSGNDVVLVGTSLPPDSKRPSGWRGYVELVHMDLDSGAIGDRQEIPFLHPPAWVAVSQDGDRITLVCPKNHNDSWLRKEGFESGELRDDEFCYRGAGDDALVVSAKDGHRLDTVAEMAPPGIFRADWLRGSGRDLTRLGEDWVGRVDGDDVLLYRVDDGDMRRLEPRDSLSKWHYDSGYTLSLSPDGKRLAALYADDVLKHDGSAYIRVWSMENGKQIAAFQADNRNLPRLAWSPAGDVLVAATAIGGYTISEVRVEVFRLP